MEFGIPRWNWRFSPATSECFPRQKAEACQISGLIQNGKNKVQHRCFRCGEFGHFIKECKSNSRKPKSMKNLARDKLRLDDFIRKKTCSNFPFYNLNDSEFWREVSRFQSGARLEIRSLKAEIKYLNACIDEMNETDDTDAHINGLVKQISDLKQQLQSSHLQQDILCDENRKLKTDYEDVHKDNSILRNQHIRMDNQICELRKTLDIFIQSDSELRDIRDGLVKENSKLLGKIKHFKSLAETKSQQNDNQTDPTYSTKFGAVTQKIEGVVAENKEETGILESLDEHTEEAQ